MQDQLRCSIPYVSNGHEPQGLIAYGDNCKSICKSFSKSGGQYDTVLRQFISASTDDLYTNMYRAPPWAARYNTRLLVKLTLRGIVFSFLFFSLPCTTVGTCAGTRASAPVIHVLQDTARGAGCAFLSPQSSLVTEQGTGKSNNATKAFKSTRSRNAFLF